MPLWLRWVLTVLGFAALTVAAVVVVRGSGGNGGAAQRSAQARADRLGRIVLASDQAPRGASLSGRQAPRLALERVIVADMRQRIRRSELSGPLQGVRCQRAARSPDGRRAFRCTVRAGGVPYPFLGVVDLRGRRVTWCKHDPGPTAASEIPVSPRCRA